MNKISFGGGGGGGGPGIEKIIYLKFFSIFTIFTFIFPGLGFHSIFQGGGPPLSFPARTSPNPPPPHPYNTPLCVEAFFKVV